MINKRSVIVRDVCSALAFMLAVFMVARYAFLGDVERATLCTFSAAVFGVLFLTAAAAEPKQGGRI